MKLRDYQQKSIDMLYDWMRANDGHPCVVLPTGAGKSVIIAELAKGAVQQWPETKVLMLCAQKEILEQNAAKMRSLWPGAPMGIYHAGLRRRTLGEPITFAGIQSIRKRAGDVGHIDICIVDECHMISHHDEGAYRKLISDLLVVNPRMRVIGYSGTPYRLGHGLITDKPAIFDALIEPVTLEELWARGFLSPLSCKRTDHNYNTAGVHKRGGEFIESELQKLVDTAEQNAIVAKEIASHAEGRRSILVFATGVAHAENMAAALCAQGIEAKCVHGGMPAGERDALIRDFKAGKIRCLTNANILTVGFDHPGIDLVALCRPTESTALYVQMVGRGLRITEGKKDCLILDFAGCVRQHGPITNPRIKDHKSTGDGDAPVKDCPECAELVHLSAKACPACGFVFPVKENKTPAVNVSLVDGDIMGTGEEVETLEVTEWEWREQVSHTSKKNMVTVRYYGCLSDKPVTEYLCLNHGGYTGQKAWDTLTRIAGAVSKHLEPGLLAEGNIGAICDAMNKAPHPSRLTYTQEVKFCKVKSREW